MNFLSLPPIHSPRAQRGVAAVEFALVAIPFFLLLFGAIEFGRLLYLWNTVQEVTRHAARQAVVTNFTDTAAIDAIKRAAVFGIDDARITPYYLPASSEIFNTRVVIRWLNSSNCDDNDDCVVNPLPASPADNVAACLDAGRVAQCIRYVEVCVSTTGTTCEAENSITFAPLLGLFFPLLGDVPIPGIPMSTVRMPAESLGFGPGT